MAIVVGVGIALLRLPLRDLLGPEAPFLTCWLGVLAAAYLGGLWPAAIVGIVAFAIGRYVQFTEGVSGLPTWIYVACALAFAVPGEVYRRMLQRREVDAQRLAEMRIRMTRVARLNALGELAGTLAHELNQPLTAISSYADAAQWPLRESEAEFAPAVIEMLQKISNQTTRARQIISRIRGHVAGDEIQLVRESLSQLVREAVEISAARFVRNGVQLRYEFDPRADVVMADRIEIQQVIVNLVRNAAEAMAGQPRREVVIRSRALSEDLAECSVSDTGKGIAPDILSSLFEPFASNKSDGMGMGLAVSRNIVEAHGGSIRAESTPKVGTTFFFTLRRATSSVGIAE